MSGFSADWLALREPADRAARDPDLLARLAEALAERDRLTIVDLGCGSGSGLRALAPQLAGPQLWRLVDDDEALLEIAAASAAPVRDREGQPVRTEIRRANLAASGWEAAGEGADLIAMSALLDLVSEDFLTRLARLARAENAPVHAALTVDGRMGCTPDDPLDEAVFSAFRAHMVGEKGFGPALGPAATQAAARVFATNGFAVETARSDWVVGASHAALASALLEGWIEAAGETGLVPPHPLSRWAALRRTQIAAGSLELRVGHLDLLALPR